MTKPTYSELYAENLRVRGLLQRQSELLKKSLPTLRWAAAMEFDSTRLDDLNHVVEVERFLAESDIPEPDEHGDYKSEADAQRARDACLRSMRERGLTYSFRNNGAEPESSEVTDSEHTKEIDLVPQGAESADIGKLDAAACICLPDADDFDKNCPKHGYVARFNAKGSAETGGEKAAPWNGAFYIKRGDQYHCQFRDMILYVTNSGTEEKFAAQWCADFNKRLSEHNAEMLAEKAKELAQRVWMRLTDPEPPNFPRTSQNQTVSSGVEGAHEGTTADKSGWRSANEAPDADMGCPDALAESSLSSPPPKCRHCPSRLGEHHVHNCAFWGQVLPSECLPETTVRQSPSLSESGAESAHSGKQNTADKSELLPTQLPKEK